MSLDFHPQHQTYLLVGTNVGDIGIWEVGSRERIAHKSFKVWNPHSCTVPLQVLILVKKMYKRNHNLDFMETSLVVSIASTFVVVVEGFVDGIHFQKSIKRSSIYVNNICNH